MKKTVQERTIVEKINPEFFRDSKNTMPVNAGNKLTRHMKRAELIVFITARRTKTAFATKRNEFKITTIGTSEHGTTVGGIATMNHLINIFDDSVPGMEFINHLFIIISKNGL